MLRVPYAELYQALHRAMLQLGLKDDPENPDNPDDKANRAALCARLFAETTRDGVYSHGLNRFPRFAAMIRNGSIHVDAKPTRVTGVGAFIVRPPRRVREFRRRPVRRPAPWGCAGVLGTPRATCRAP